MGDQELTPAGTGANGIGSTTEDGPDDTTPTGQNRTLAEVAVSYAAQGWPIFPIDGKTPLPGSHGFKDAVTDLFKVIDWWSDCPDCGIATALPPSLVVVDVDGIGGMETLARLEGEHGPVPETLAVLTGGGGLHLYFLHPGGSLRQTAGLIGPGIDTRIPGRGYVVVPPSPHPSGRRYEWYDPTRPATAMPSWMVSALRPPRERPRDMYQGTGDGRLAGLCRAVAGAPVGQRNHVLNWAAYQARDIGDRDRVTAALTEAAKTAGLDDREIARTIRSGLGEAA